MAAALRDLDGVAGAARTAGEAYDVFRRAATDAGSGADTVGRAARASARDINDFDRSASAAARSMSDLGDHFDRAGGSAGRFGRDAGGADRGMRAIGSGARSTAVELRGAAIEMHDFGDGVYRTIDAVGSAVRTGSGVSRLGSMFSESAGEMLSMGGIAGQGLGMVAKGMGLVTAGAGVAAVGAGIVTGAVGAMGVASVGAVGLVGAGMGMGAAAFVDHAADVLAESSRFRGEFKAIGRDVRAWEEDTYAPIGEAVVGLARQFKAAGPDLGAPIKAGLGVARDAVLDAGPDLVRGSQVIADSVGRIITDTAPSISTLTRSFPALATSTTSAVEQVTRAFNAGFQEQWPRALPHVQSMVGAVGELGAELMRTGAANLVPFTNNVEALTESATTMVRNLGPSMPKAMGAFTDVAGIGMDALGGPQVAEGIDMFADSIRRNRPQLTAMAGDLAAGGFAAGTGFVEGLAGSADAVGYMGDALQRNQQTIATTVDATVSTIATSIGAGADMVELAPSLIFGGPAKLGEAVYQQFFGASGGGAPAAPGAPATGATGAAAPPRVPFARTPEGYSITPDLPADINPDTGEMTGPRADAIKGHYGISPSRPYYTDISKMPNNPDIPDPQPVPGPPPEPAGSMEELLGGPVRGRVGSSYGGVLRREIQDAAPEVEQAGASLGASAGSGLEQGIQSSVTRVETITRRTMRRVIDVAADEWDSHSPSREWDKLGYTGPQGLAGGMERGFGLVERAGHRVAENALGAAADTAAMNRAGQSAGQSYATGLGAGMAGTPPGTRAGQPPTPVPPGGGAGDPLWQVGSGGVQSPAEVQRGEDARLREQQQAVQAARMGRAQDARSAAGMPASPGGDEGFGRSDTFLDRQEKHNQRAQDIRDRAQRNKERAMRQANPGMSDSQFATMLDTRQPGKTSFTYSTYTPSPSPGWEGPNPGGVGAARARSEGKDVGMAFTQGADQGVKAGTPGLLSTVKGTSGKVGAATRDELQVRSPSQVAARIGRDYTSGLGMGMADAVSGAASRVGAVASDRGLQVGYSWVRGLVSGVDTQMKRSDFQQVAVPKIENERARAALGAARLLGPAGAGAAIGKNPMVTLGGATITATTRTAQPINVYLDGKPFRQMIVESQDQLVIEMNDALVGARG